MLLHFNATKPLVVQCDSSKDGLGAVLLQDDHPIAYASRALTTTEQHYAQIEKELLSVVFALTRFHQYTYGRPVTVQNDHKPLVTIQHKAIAKAPVRLQRMLMRLTDYEYTIIHLPGKDMHLADALSRAFLQGEEEAMVFDSVNAVTVSDLTPTELAELKIGTDQDAQMCELRSTIKTGWPAKREDCPTNVRPYWDFRDELTTCDDVVVKGQTIVVPQSLRGHYIQLAHAAHQGADSCIRRARQSVFWPGMTAELRAAVERCETCA